MPDLTLQFASDAPAPGDAGPPPSTSTESDDAKKLRRKLRETYEHRPRKLQILVDGEVRGVQTISGPSNHFQIKLPPLSRPDFVEVLSEQGLGLVYLDLQDIPEAPSPRHALVDLSDERSLSVTLTLADGAPVIDVSYYDPLLEPGTEGPPPAVEASPERAGSLESNAFSQENQPISRLRRLLDRLRNGWVKTRVMNLCIVLGICVVFALVLEVNVPVAKSVQPTAKDILTQSIHRTRGAIPLYGAARGRFSFEVRSEEGRILASGEVDSLRSPDSPQRTIQLRGPDGELLAGHWVDANGNVTEYAKGSRGAGPGGDAAPPVFDGMWKSVPDAQDFATLGTGRQNLSVRPAPHGYEVAFNANAVSDQPTITGARLMIDSGSMRPLSEILRVQRGHAVREYRFREISYEVLRSDQINAGDFEPDSNLYQSFHRRGLTPAGTDITQLALRALDVLGAQSEEIDNAVDLERSSSGKIEIRGVLPSEAQKKALIESLRSLPESADLRLELHSTDDAKEKRSTVNRRDVGFLRPIIIGDDRLPLDRLLRDRLASQGLSGPDLELHIRQAAGELVQHVARVHREAWIVEQIGARDFSVRELQAMRPSDRMLWLALLDRHLDVLAHELNILDTNLKPLPHSKDAQPSTTAAFAIPSPRNLNELSTVAQALDLDSERLDRSLTTGFTLSSSDIPSKLNVAEITELLADLRIQEGRLHETVARLQTSRHETHRVTPQI